MRNSDALTRAGLNLIQQALSIFDSDLRLVAANRPMQNMFNLPDDLVATGARFEDVIRYLAVQGEYGPIDDLEDFITARVELARAFEPHYMERSRANGRTISVEGAPLPQGGWVTVYTDITRVKEQEELLRTRSELLSEEVLRHSEQLAATNRQLAATVSALEEARRELTEIEARTRLVTEMMPAHIAHVDASGHYTYSNQRLSAVLPGRKANILGLHISEALGAEAFGRVEPYLQRAFDGAQSTFEFTDSDSARRIRVVFTPDERENGVYVLSMDVTEETQARVALQQTRRREIAAQLTSGLAHDFSNLLTIILGMQDKLKRLDLGLDASKLIGGTVQAARRGGDLLERISGITGQREHRPEHTDLSEFLASIETLARASLPEDITLAISNDLENPLLLDQGMLQDGLLNLILNARDACAGHGQIRLEATAISDTWLQVQVTDTGPGFSEDALEKALSPFFTTKGSGGSGLGLSMVYDTTKLAGGDVRLANTGDGAQVTLRLPLRLAPTEGDLGGLVMLVEDDPDLRATIRDMLTAMSLSVVEATSVDEACALAAGLPDVNLVLSDVTLEGGATGVDLVDRLPQKRVQLMTGLPPDHPLHIAAARRGDVLRKPFAPETLARVLLSHPRNAA